MKLVIEPGRTVKNYWRDLWQYRELMYFLAWRDIAVRYVWYSRRMERGFADVI